MKKIILSAALFTIVFTSCTPAAMEGLGRGLSQGSSQKTVGIICSGKTFGTITTANAELRLSISSDGKTSGTFINNGTSFAAEGFTPVRDEDHQLKFSQIDLKLDSRVQGGATGLAGTRPVGLAGGYGSTGTLVGSIDTNGAFTGTFKGIQGSYRTLMSCRGA